VTSLMDVMHPTAVSAAIDKTPLGPKASGRQGVEMERAASKGAGNKLVGTRVEADKVFKPKWTTEFSWLKKVVFERVKDGTSETYLVTAMLCNACELAKMVSVFTIKGGGCTSMRRSRLLEHDASANHQSAMQREKASHEFKVACYAVFEDEDSKLLNLTVQVYGLFKLSDSLKSFASRCNLAEVSSVRVKISEDINDARFKNHSIDLGKSYRNPHFASEMAWNISNALKNQQAKRLSSSDVFSNAVDEASARDKRTSCIQYVCFMENGQAVQEFANLMPIPKADAESVFDADSAALAEMFGGDAVAMQKKHVGFSSDGASVMTGTVNGVAARHKRENPFCTSHHCVCHKLDLSGTGAAANVPEIGEDFKKELHSMYNHFNLSGKKRLAFAKAQRKLDMKEAQIKKDFFTRWLSLGDATQSARKNVLPLHKYLTEEPSDVLGDTAPELLKTLESHKYLLTLVAMDDILAKMNLLSLILQKNFTSFRSVCVLSFNIVVHKI
jgi:hypothetical protein